MVAQTTGGGIEYVSVRNRSTGPVNLQCFPLQVLDTETAQVDPGSPGVMINEAVQAQPGQSFCLVRVPDVVDADGERVAGTFDAGEALGIGPGDRVALLDSRGALANAIITV
jgi:hypothetical protein